MGTMLESILRAAVPTLWVAWLLYWFVASRNMKATAWRESLPSQLLHRILFLLAAILLVEPRSLPAVLRERVLPPELASLALGAVVVAAGLGFAVWARRHLGRNWSAAVTVKKDHALIRTGPYRYVRHPIYAGILLAFVGTAVWVGEWRGVAALLFAAMAVVYKITVEDQRLRETFPHFDQYRRETAALIPFVF